MPDLNDDNIQLIKNDLEQSGIKNNLLKDELLDHICCRIEAEMENGLDFQQAYHKTSAIYTRKELHRTEQNLSFLINYKSILTTWLLYVSIVFYFLSWITYLNQADWLGLTSFLLVSFVFLRFSIIFHIDVNLKKNKLLSILSGIVFVFFFTGSILRFAWLSYGYANPHVFPMLVFSWLLLSVLNFIYYYNLNRTFAQKQSKSGAKVYLFITVAHLLLAGLSMSTFFIPPLLQYVPLLAVIIVIFDAFLFLVVMVNKQTGKSLVKSLIVSSFLIAFIYFPLKSFFNSSELTVQFEVITQPEFNGNKLYMHINYFKYGKETIILERQGEYLFKSKPIQFKGGGLKMVYKITDQRKDIFGVLYDNEIQGSTLNLLHSDTTFLIKYQP